ncbi:delta(3,5)-Delta(2,4)-dienoyl-CoA isomerase, mitochondrial [Anastrepha ludens]|uniref:delta(3,5)-Delta(2,4)-dienoyl-CoA isomerase, mitochondrial n=1 Tax=Anastrepha ludens TaxID=28586 RepID=UPI0023AF18F2|nr:delta(3,5)-Delta(2,4)-dienoyl-CoA isomerase, mitochondrial [Anastrepha ludens]XP_053949576.1 delta(3,5)-Delta(2,4)-dienoyl-CoA isomerase, mitochondrial [Anastrepha ludens]
MALSASGKKSFVLLGSFVPRTFIPKVQRNMSSTILHKSGGDLKYHTLHVTTPKPFVYHVELNRPKNLNTFNKDMWLEIEQCFENLSASPECRVIVLSAIGKHFTGGLDLADAMKFGQELGAVEDVARKAVLLEHIIKLYQNSISSLEVCPKPVITAIHSACIGAGVDLITAADIRYCSENAFFCVKEVDIGMAADVGVLQRLPKVVGSESLARELCFTARRFGAAEAHSFGLVSKVFPTKEACVEGALELAATIAEKSPVAVQATKRNIVYSQSRPNQDGLDHIRQMNTINMQSEDFAKAAVSSLTKEQPTFSKL